MLTLYLYPQLFGVPDNNPFGLKVDTFLRLAKINYQVKHIVDTKAAPRGQLPYIVEGDHVVTDSNVIIQYLTKKYKINLDKQLTEAQKNLHFLIIRLLDNSMYWVMSYSRWQDERFWPLFKNEFLRQFPDFTKDTLEQARKHNIEKYHYQGIGKYPQDYIYQTGLDNLKSLRFILGKQNFCFGAQVHTIDACCYGFLANILYFDIDTPLKAFMVDDGVLSDYTQRIRALLNY